MLWGILTSIFWALVITVLLWVICAFAGKMINASFRMEVRHHLLCFVIAVPTLILLTTAFTLGKAARLVTTIDTKITQTLVNNKQFINQLELQITSAISNSDTEGIKEYIADNFMANVADNYPMLKKRLNLDDIIGSNNITALIEENAQSQNINYTQIVGSIVTGFTKNIRHSINMIRLKALITVLVLQLIVFGIMIYKADRYRKPAQRTRSAYNFNDNI